MEFSETLRAVALSAYTSMSRVWIGIDHPHLKHGRKFIVLQYNVDGIIHHRFWRVNDEDRTLSIWQIHFLIDRDGLNRTMIVQDFDGDRDHFDKDMIIFRMFGDE
jgi:hypothetical protein